MVEETEVPVEDAQPVADFSFLDTTPENANLSPAEQKKLDKEAKALEKKKNKWKVFVDFLLRHLSIVTTKYASWEKDDFETFKVNDLATSQVVAFGLNISQRKLSTSLVSN